jgi:hypothetical protein
MLTLNQLFGAGAPHDPVRRGYHVVYRPHERNHCPGCGRSHWIVGRLLAECAFCATALPLVEAGDRRRPVPPQLARPRNRGARRLN